jgi:hypothetical protein
MNWFNVSPPSFARKLIDRCVTFQTMENKKTQKISVSFVLLNLLFVCLFVCLFVAGSRPGPDSSAAFGCALPRRGRYI